MLDLKKKYFNKEKSDYHFLWGYTHENTIPFKDIF
jgi:hypothetical protein